MIFERVKEEVKEEILNVIERIYGIEKKNFNDYIFLMAGKHKVFTMNKKNVAKLVEEKLEIVLKKSYRVGLLLGEIDKRGFRFSIDGSLIFGKFANKNIYKMNEEEVYDWLRGLDLELNIDKIKNYTNERYVLMYDGEFYYGSGLIMGNKIKNMIPKIRRIRKLSDL